jgi:acetoin utilization deacetylase AcuC-like enzyme
MSDTYVSAQSLQAAKCAAGAACRAVDIALCGDNTNVFVCTRPPGHHAGRYGCTGGCLSTGFCLLNNAAIAAVYGRVRWGLERVAVVDIDVHFGNGTAELLRGDPRAFFASVHMIYGEGNDGSDEAEAGKAGAGFYPALLGVTEVTDNYVSVGVYPPSDEGPGRLPGRSASSASIGSTHSAHSAHSTQSANKPDEEMDVEEVGVASATRATAAAAAAAASSGSAGAGGAGSFVGMEGFRRALSEVIIPQMERFNPQLLIISAGFDGYHSDPIGGELQLTTEDYAWCTQQLMEAMDRVAGGSGRGRVVRLLEGGYDTKPQTLGLAKCVDSHVRALRTGGL